MSSSDFPLSFEALVVLVSQGPYSAGFYSRPAALVPSLPSWGEAINGLLEKSLDAGVLDLSRPVGLKGEGILVLAERAMGPDSPGVCEKVLLGAKDGLGPFVGGQPALLQVLPGFLERRSTNNAPIAVDRIARWVSASPRREITAMDPPEGPDGIGLLRWMTKEHWKSVESISPEGWACIIQGLRRAGVDWVHPGIAQHPAIPSKLLKALCKDGLNFADPWEGVPTWKQLLRMNRPPITRVVEDHMGYSPGLTSAHAQEQIAVASYLSNFSRLTDDRREERRAGLAKEQRNRVVSHLTSMSGWHEITDDFGRSAFFHALLANPGVLRHALKKVISGSPKEKDEWEKALVHRDEKGRNLWFYLYQRHASHTLTPALLGQLAQLVPSSMDAQGNSLAVQLLTNPKGSLRSLSLPGRYNPKERFDRIPHGEGWSNPIKDWEKSDPISRKKALVGALTAPYLSCGLMEQLPCDEETAAYKALSMLLYAPKYCLPGEANHKRLKTILEVMKESPSCRLDVPPEIMEKYLSKIPKALSRNEWISEVSGDLTRLAMESHLESHLPSPVPSQRIRL